MCRELFGELGRGLSEELVLVQVPVEVREFLDLVSVPGWVGDLVAESEFAVQESQ
ncbi:hypothetical protein NCWK1_0839 [Nostoc cycadae WK-1]|uniref:Uncharacterized protein n=1 Tax=Nostoc cycadae WK-1 TaxID=1861711 RepID=A0A2H6LD10_9NOSO|nr:hypothetical protein NCWK1_0839 [Nostoc cycadae WK-1]